MHLPEPSSPEPIAIIGIGCRFPGGAHDPESFWALLREGVDAIVEVPPDRWSIASYYSPDASRPGTAVTRWGGFIQQRVDEFDALFFGMSPREAAHLDPMQRWMLEVTWEALEDGGLVPEQLASTNTGVFVGAFTEDIKIMRMSESNRPLIDAHTGTGSAMTMVANRLSYVFDLRGPSVALDTACSSSLVAVHLACQSLWNGECSLALAGGVNAMFKPEATIAESKAGMLSPDGRCKAFDAGANGYVRGEGAGVVVLKPLARALADGDPIYALIRGSAVNQDGHTNGITVPSHAAQKALMEEACRRAHVSPGQLQYVEAHGTGTPVGDPIEANALAAALSVDRPAGSTCIIGSVKTNIGHLEAAAGVAGLIKAALCLTHRQIPPHLHLQHINPGIPLDDLCVRIPQTLEPWPDGPGPALAAVNSFGFGGTNAHVILQEAPAPQQRMAPAEQASLTSRAELAILSARSPQALQARARRCREWIGSQAIGHDVRLCDIAYTTTMRRSHHDYRLAVVARSTEELAERLETYLTDEARADMVAGRKIAGRQPKLAFVFSGMGPQWWAMGRQLLEQEEVFRAAIERCDALMRPYAGWSLVQEMMADEAHSRMTETQIAQPANFALQVGLAELWRSWGIQPDAIVGHSAGEVAAAYQAGAMSLDEALRVIFHRSRLQHLTTGQGKLVAIGLPLAEARQVIDGYEDRVSIAAVNSPSAVTLVGDPAALDEIVGPLQRREVFCRYLAVNVPYHSHYMDPLRGELLDALDGLALRPATLPLLSTVTGDYATGEEMDAGYWWRNVRDPVLFAEAIDRLIDDGYEIFLEISPHPVLTASIAECLALRERTGRAVPSLRRKSDERVTMLEALGSLYTLGFPAAFAALQYSHPRLVRLPTYPWQRERHWEESAESVQDRLSGPVHPLLGRRSTAAHPAWDVTLDRQATPFLDDHRIQGAVVYPGAAYIEMGLAAARQVLGESTPSIELHDVEFRKALFWADGADPSLQMILHPRGLTFDIYSRTRGMHQEWRHHARGRVGQGYMRVAPTTGLTEIRRRCTQETPAVEAYAGFAAMGLHYGPCFQGIERLWRGDGEALALLRAPDAIAAELPAYHVHPAVLDACFQVLIASVAAPDGVTAPGAYMPITIDRVRVYGPLPAQMWVHTRLTEQNDTLVTGDLQLCDETGRVALEVQGLRALSLEHRGNGAMEQTDDLFYELIWQPADRLAEVTDGGSAGSGTEGCWLIFADEGGVGRSLATLLEERGESCVLVTPGESYLRPDHGNRFSLNPACPDEFQRLLLDACGEKRCRGILYLWGLQSPATATLDTAALQAAQTLGCIGLMHCVQAVEGTPWRESPFLWVVTRGAQSIGATDGPVAVAQAPLWGLARTIGHQEHGGLWGGAVDLDPAVPHGEASFLLEEIWAGPGADQVALRGKQRYIPQLVRRRDMGRTAMSPPFRPDGSYLITGGLGGLGLQIAAWMIEQGARRLILLGRTALPARSTWSMVTEGTPEAARIAAVRRLEAMGASIHVAAVDVAEEDELSAFLEEYRHEGWPAIRGVVHSAGVTYSQLLLNMSAESFQRVLRPKVQGAWLLHRLLQDEPLDFFVLFSSVASLGFSLGLGAYAAGNAFLDALAHHRRAQGLPALSVNWGPWAEVGMASQPDLSAYFTQRGLIPLPPEQGMHCLAQLFGADQVQATVLAADWPLVRHHGYGSGRVPRMLDQLGEEQATPETTTERQDGARIKADLQDVVDESARRGLMGSYLAAQVARVLRLSESSRAALDLLEPLNTLGIDSLMAIELKNGIAADLGVAVSVVSFLQGASIADLANEVLERLPSPGEEGQPESEQATGEPAVQLDQLSDAAVDALLNMMLAEGTVHHD